MEKLELVVEYLNLEFSGEIRPRDINLRAIYIEKAFEARKLNDATKGVIINKEDRQGLMKPRQFQGQKMGKTSKED